MKDVKKFLHGNLYTHRAQVGKILYDKDKSTGKITLLYFFPTKVKEDFLCF
jgi:hypothetical protein